MTAQLIPFISLGISVGGILFQTGKHAEKIDIIGVKVEALDEKEEYINKNIYEMKSDLKLLTHDVSSIKVDVRELKDRKK
jgi:hypothetical protein